MVKTPTGIRKYGFTVAAKIIDPNIAKKICVPSSIDFGKNSSTALKMAKASCVIEYIYWQNIAYPISLENRFKIRPDGLVSKNRMVVEMIPLNMALWMFWEIFTQIS